MKLWRAFSCLVGAAVCCLYLAGCSGDTPWHFTGATPAQPSGVVATAGDGQVTLNWSAAANAAGYRIYYGTTPGVTPGSASTVPAVSGTSWTVAGLSNGTAYYFTVAAVNTGVESTPSAEVSATPAALGAYSQQDLEGSWNFNILVSGANPGWMRGKVAVGSTGAVSFTLYQDSAGRSAPPLALFPVLHLDSVGRVSAAGGFVGAISSRRTLITGTSSWDNSSRLLAILQKEVPGITFSNEGDLKGFGSAGGGARRFVYHQISSGPGAEWEWAAGEIGQDLRVQYTAYTAPSNPLRPKEKATILGIGADGIVTENLTGALPRPAVLMDRAVMSADKTVMVGSATDNSVAPARYVLRVYQMVDIGANDVNTFAAADLAGSYRFHKIVTGSSTLAASGAVEIDASGSLAFTEYADSAGGAAPLSFAVSSDSEGNVTAAGDASLHGKLSYLKDFLVFTRSEGNGGWSMELALKN